MHGIYGGIRISGPHSSKLTRDSYLSFISGPEMSFVLAKCGAQCQTRVQHPDEVCESDPMTLWGPIFIRFPFVL